MHTDRTVQIPLRDRKGEVRAVATIDVEDSALADLRWKLDPNGYASRSVRVDGRMRTVRLHREVLGLVHGDGLQADHVNGDRLDNRRQNLRVATEAENRQNVPGLTRTSRFRGVCWNRTARKWQAQVKTNGRQNYLGVFEREEDAAEAARAFRAAHLPFSVDRAS